MQQKFVKKLEKLVGIFKYNFSYQTYLDYNASHKKHNSRGTEGHILHEDLVSKETKKYETSNCEITTKIPTDLLSHLDDSTFTLNEHYSPAPFDD